MTYLKENNHFIVTIILILTLILFMYWNVFVDLLEVWSSKEEYSHGFMIPLVCIYFLWQKKDAIRKEQSQSTVLGFLVCFLALLLYFFGTVGDLFSALRFSFIFLLFGLAFLWVGYKSTKIMLAPLLILIFSFPLPSGIQADLTIKLQLLSSRLGVSIIRACDIPVYLEGNMIDLGSYQLEVVEACSGLRYLFPLMGLAFICAYLYQVTFWKRALIFFTSIPITLLMNSFRIGVIGILVNSWGIASAEGFIHDFEGWVVFLACIAILILEMWLLSWHERKTKTWDNIFGLTISEIPKVYEPINIAIKPIYGVIFLLCLATFVIKPLGERKDFIPIRKDFFSFPTQISTWNGVRDNLDLKTVKFLNLSDYVLINFKNPDNKIVNFYAAYYETQKHGAVPHSPKQCIPGGGWQIKAIKTASYQGVNFNRVLIQKEDQKQLVYYWYKQRDKTIANEYQLKWNTFLESFENRRTEATLVRLTTSLSENETFEIADERLKQFILIIKPKFTNYIPD